MDNDGSRPSSRRHVKEEKRFVLVGGAYFLLLSPSRRLGPHLRGVDDLEEKIAGVLLRRRTQISARHHDEQRTAKGRNEGDKKMKPTKEREEKKKNRKQKKKKAQTLFLFFVVLNRA